MRRSAIAAAVAATVAGVVVARRRPSARASGSAAARRACRRSRRACDARTRRSCTTPRPVHPTSDPIPILMYHVIADPPADAPYPELYVSGDDFARQIGWLGATATTP